MSTNETLPNDSAGEKRTTECGTGTSPLHSDNYRQTSISDFEKPYQIEELLEHLYCEKSMSQRDIADRLGCSDRTVADYMSEYGIETRSRSEAAIEKLGTNYAAFFTMKEGYEIWSCSSANDAMLVHRLLAISEWGFETVANNHVHHKNSIRWDNRVENLEVIDPRRHGKLHFDGKKRIAGSD